MVQVPSSFDRVVVMADFGGLSPEELYDHWVDPVRLVHWWPKQASTNPTPGGKYRFDWPEQGSVLEGEYLEAVRGHRLIFTWSWTHQPARRQPMRVEVYFEPLLEGARMAIYHGPFDQDEADERQGVAEGWIHFGMLLAGLHPGATR